MTRNFLVRVGGSPAGAQGLRRDMEATRLGGKTPVRGSARIFEHKASFFVDNKTPSKSDRNPGCRSGPVHCIVDSFTSRVRLLRTKQRLFRSAGMLEPLGSPPPTHRSQIPPRSCTSSPACSQIRLFGPQPLANIIFYFLIWVKSPTLAPTSPHHFLPSRRYRSTPDGPRFPTELRDQRCSLLYKAAIFLGLARINTKIHPASVEGDVAFLSLLGGAVISHLVNPHLKSRYPP